MLGNMMVTQFEKVKDELILERYDIELLGECTIECLNVK
jgi:hypothetical protein